MLTNARINDANMSDHMERSQRHLRWADIETTIYDRTPSPIASPVVPPRMIDSADSSPEFGGTEELQVHLMSRRFPSTFSRGSVASGADIGYRHHSSTQALVPAAQTTQALPIIDTTRYIVNAPTLLSGAHHSPTHELTNDLPTSNNSLGLALDARRDPLASRDDAPARMPVITNNTATDTSILHPVLQDFKIEDWDVRQTPFHQLSGLDPYLDDPVFSDQRKSCVLSFLPYAGATQDASAGEFACSITVTGHIQDDVPLPLKVWDVLMKVEEVLHQTRGETYVPSWHPIRAKAVAARDYRLGRTQAGGRACQDEESWQRVDVWPGERELFFEGLRPNVCDGRQVFVVHFSIPIAE
ncbi:hypothetical protein C8Q79DRAFT_1014360 [Trametes meyenii]|nr:hypothetical protein C8Q79DRAFT_1014360 [Trametes meyenii]